MMSDLIKRPDYKAATMGTRRTLREILKVRRQLPPAD
jgi:hypothetical protein